MTEALDVFKEEGGELFSLIVRIRVLEDRNLTRSVDIFLERLRENGRDKDNYLINPMKQAGQFDILFHLSAASIMRLYHIYKDKEDGRFASDGYSIYALLTCIVSDPYIDQIETLLLYKSFI